MDTAAVLGRLEQWVAQRNDEMPPGIVAGVSATVEQHDDDSNRPLFRFTVITEPFSEFAEVTADAAAFMVGPDAITGITLETSGLSAKHPDLPATDEGVAELELLLKAWLEEVCPPL